METTEGAAPGGAGLDLGALIGQLIGGGVSSGVLTLIGLIRNMMRS